MGEQPTSTPSSKSAKALDLLLFLRKEAELVHAALTSTQETCCLKFHILLEPLKTTLEHRGALGVLLPFVFFPPSFIQNFPTVCEMTTRFHHGSWVVQPASSGRPVRDLAALPGCWGLQTSSGTFQMTGFCHLISSECERTNCPDALTVKLTV